MPQKKSKTKAESQLDLVVRNVASLTASMAELAQSVAHLTKAIASLTMYVKENVATKKELFEAETRIRSVMAIEEDAEELEDKLIENTGRPLIQRVSRLEKEVFHKTA